ncbi:hypothetical protein [Hoeflea sp.]|uniref:hypothetical protein n=1 Tax=Hoeflea sp. TaxID=1940281 RepID=UPI003B52ABAF
MLPKTNPGLPARDFESEVDQDFSDILEADLASVELDGERAYPAASASAPGWGLDARADAADVDAFDDYTSLERELGDSRGPDEDPDVAPPYRSENGVAAAPDGLDGEYATGMQGAGDDGEQRDSRAPLVALIVLGVAVFAGGRGIRLVHDVGRRRRSNRRSKDYSCGQGTGERSCLKTRAG